MLVVYIFFQKSHGDLTRKINIHAINKKTENGRESVLTGKFVSKSFSCGNFKRRYCVRGNGVSLNYNRCLNYITCIHEL